MENASQPQTIILWSLTDCRKSALISRFTAGVYWGKTGY